MARVINFLSGLFALGMLLIFGLASIGFMAGSDTREPDWTAAVICLIVFAANGFWLWRCARRERLYRLTGAITKLLGDKEIIVVADLALALSVPWPKAKRSLEWFLAEGGQRLYHNPETESYSLKPISDQAAVGDCKRCGSPNWSQNSLKQIHCDHCGARR